MTLTQQLVEECIGRGWTLAAAESLTAGLVCSGIADVPGASAVLRGGAVTYATDAKAHVLGVDVALLDARGAVDAEVARQMAVGVRRLYAADFGVATTGVAGPTEQDGKPVGTVFVAVAYAGESSEHPVRCDVQQFQFAGDRAFIRTASARAAWQRCLDTVRRNDTPSPLSVAPDSLTSPAGHSQEDQ